MLAAVPGLLLLPLLAMALTEEVRWSAMDFATMGAMLYAVVLGIELGLRRFKSPKKRILCCAGVLLGFALLWAELAVGVFHSPIAGS